MPPVFLAVALVFCSLIEILIKWNLLHAPWPYCNPYALAACVLAMSAGGAMIDRDMRKHCRGRREIVCPDLRRMTPGEVTRK